MDTPPVIESAKNAITSSITSEQAFETLKVQSAQITTEFLGWLKNAAADAGSFVAEQTPLFVREFLTWHFYRACIYGFMTTLPVILLFILMRFFWKRTKDLPLNSKELPTPTQGKLLSMLLFVPIGAVLYFGTAHYAMEAVKIKIAPRVYLVDWLSETLTGKNVSDANHPVNSIK